MSKTINHHQKNITETPIGFIGASKTGTVLANYFKHSGLSIIGMWSHNENAMLESHTITNIPSYTNMIDLVEQCDVIIISTADDKIMTTWQNLCNYPKQIQHKLFCHLSGVLTSNIFHATTNAEILKASLHPLFSFNNKQIQPQQIKSITFTIEGDQDALRIIRELLHYLNNPYVKIKENDKIKYHLAAVLLSSGINGLFIWAQKLFPNNKILNAVLDNLTLPVIQRLLKNPTPTITGPTARNDVNTLQKYLDLNISIEEQQCMGFLFKQTLPYTTLTNFQQQNIIDLYQNNLKTEL